MIVSSICLHYLLLPSVHPSISLILLHDHYLFEMRMWMAYSLLCISLRRHHSRVQIGTRHSRMSWRMKSSSLNQYPFQGTFSAFLFEFGFYWLSTSSCPPLRPDLTLEQNSNCKSCIRKLLIKDENKRLGSASGASEVKQHKWFASVNWGLLRNMTPPVSDSCASTHFCQREYLMIGWFSHYRLSPRNQMELIQ